MKNILVVTEHLKGEFQEITFEMLGKGRELAADLGGQCIALVFGNMKSKADLLGAADRVVSIGGNDDYNPETCTAAVKAVVRAKTPAVVLVGNTSMGMDIAAPLGTALAIPVVAYCNDLKAQGDSLIITSQQYGGKINVETVTPPPVVISILPGSFNPEKGQIPGSPEVEDFPVEIGAGKVRFKKLIEPEAAEVDITQSEILVAIGRGIGNRDNIEIARELARALGADIACSRPLVDAGWLPKAHQVGKSGMKVKPRVYLALGISGAPEHVEGMKNAATIIAVNTDKNAPIFDVAHYGMVDDLFAVCEELINELK
ncbi:MAG: electron transfer flavoprotein subunit alpha/FixB family protein [FCB group bacterium]|nr:electron transfer flavoprotein subunit alpha/FixB family protein [FCB group bacterium]